ncbi:hypothetical protein CSW59_06780 [Caulobacter sp. BP25]|nr:hypothetical protein CSW59_06780 [Caulobacter sp. BP25]
MEKGRPSPEAEIEALRFAVTFLIADRMGDHGPEAAKVLADALPFAFEGNEDGLAPERRFRRAEVASILRAIADRALTISEASQDP